MNKPPFKRGGFMPEKENNNPIISDKEAVIGMGHVIYGSMDFHISAIHTISTPFEIAKTKEEIIKQFNKFKGL